ncbi:hypothetical protein EW146_g2682 [Bondarzewia mesenterica]|uniref:Uncharacterized protein n=1 Tax=Bondarzewia mesenterica TaxID=1095465 RepID=A0A4S4LZU7_9AGAM|nr:hypothetical protein EW146_g2682 [Bondarzewia mesenterica]
MRNQRIVGHDPRGWYPCLYAQDLSRRGKGGQRRPKEAKVWRHQREAQGIPPWIAKGNVQPLHPTIDMEMSLVRDVAKSSWTLRQWADDYCASSKYLEELVYEKVIRALSHTQIRLINKALTRLPRALSNRWLKFLLIITLVYPFIWMFKRSHSRGGGRWAIAGSAYALKKYKPSQGEEVDIGQLEGYGPRGNYVQTRVGVQVLVGAREGEWFRRWEGTIRGAAAAREVDRAPMEQPDYNIQALDGYSS